MVLATGARPAPWALPTDGSVPVVDAATALAGGDGALPDGPVVVHDPVGGPVGVGVAEWLAGAGRDVALVTPDQVAGTLLSLTGDLADANTRLQRAGVRRELRAVVRRIAGRPGPPRGRLDRGEHAPSPAAVLVDCGHRLPEESLYRRPARHPAGRRLRGAPDASSRPCWRAAAWPWDRRRGPRPPRSPRPQEPPRDRHRPHRPPTGHAAGWPARWR